MRRHPAELGGPEHQCVSEETARFEIFDGAGRWFVQDRTVPLIVLLESLVRIPV